MVKDSPQIPPRRLRALSFSVLLKLVESDSGKGGYVVALPALKSLGIRPMSRVHIDVTTYLVEQGFVVEKSGARMILNVMVTDSGRAALDSEFP